MKRPARHDADSLSIVLPAYNESANIARAVEQALATAARLASQYEVIVVDDGSKDGMHRIVED
ncbi:MAG TPA: glycosyltransferase, partial [Candidatus Dormibacteraeota bacterium]|nr:glycosyltransferase [Candidatus Dormibacteraeota bacterium]